MPRKQAASLEDKVAAVKSVVDHLVSLCRGHESEEWKRKFYLVQQAIDDGRLQDAVREETIRSSLWTAAKWVASAELTQALDQTMSVMARHLHYPDHSEPLVELDPFSTDIRSQGERKDLKRAWESLLPPPSALEWSRAWKEASQECAGETYVDRMMGAIAHKGLDKVLAIVKERDSRRCLHQEIKGRGFEEILSDPEERTFLEALSANPGRRTDLMAYAGWLDKCQDLRGEFLQTLLTLSNVLKTGDQYQRLRDRSVEFGDQIDPIWRMAILEFWKSRILN